MLLQGSTREAWESAAGFAVRRSHARSGIRSAIAYPTSARALAGTMQPGCAAASKRVDSGENMQKR